MSPPPWPGSTPGEGSVDNVVMGSSKVSVQGAPRDLSSWTSLARRLESAGFSALLVGDHPGDGSSPWPALAAAAAVTSTLDLGTCVLQVGVREPIDIADDAATLNLLAPGRVILGMGAGHTPAEWEARGRTRPNPAGRVGRLKEVFDSVARLLDGQTVTTTGRYVTLYNAALSAAPKDQRTVRLAVGGDNTNLLRFAAQRADIIGLSGLGRTQPDGHRHEIRWTPHQVQAQIDLIAQASPAGRPSADLEVLVQTVQETADRRQAAQVVADKIGGYLPVENLLAAPYLLVGSPRQIADQLLKQQQQWGIDRYVVRESALPVMEKVLSCLPD